MAHPFFKFLKEGTIFFDENTSFIIIHNEGSFFQPVRSFNKLESELIKELGIEKTKEILKRVGMFQAEQSIRRYVKLFQFDKLEKDKIIEFLKETVSMMGIGKISILKIDGEQIEIEFNPSTIFAFEAFKEYGKQEFPWDFLASGLIERAAEMLFGSDFICEEVSCYAKGDEKCKFVCKKKD